MQAGATAGELSPNCEAVPYNWPAPGDAVRHRRGRGVTSLRSMSFAQENKTIGVVTSGGDAQGDWRQKHLQLSTCDLMTS